MSLQYIPRLLLVCLMLFVVGCFSELSKEDMIGNYPKIKMQTVENIKIVDPRIQNPIKSPLQRNGEQFNSRYQGPRFKSDPYSQKSVGNVKNSRFSPIKETASADVTHYQSKISPSVSRRNNLVELSSVKHDNRLDANRSDAFQHNPANFTGTQSRDINLAPRLVKKYGLVNRMYAKNVYGSGSFGFQHISKSDQSQPYLRENTAVQAIRPAHAERANYVSRSSTANHNMRLKSDGNPMFDQNNLMSRVVPASTSLSIVQPNHQGLKTSPHAFKTETAVSYENTRNPFPSKMLMPSIVPSNSNRGRFILPLKKALIFTSEHDLIQQSDSRRAASNSQSSFQYGNIKLSTSSYTLKDIQLTSAQSVYNMDQSGQNVPPIQTLKTQRYDNMATGVSANMPSMTNDVLFHKRFPSDKNSSMQSQILSLPNQSMKGTHVKPSKQFSENTVLFWESNKRINSQDTTNHSSRKPSQHNIQFGTDLNSSGQSTEQSLFVKNYPVPSLMPGNTMKSVHSDSPSLSDSRNQSRPYYLTSKKPYVFKGFKFVPTVQKFLQKTLIDLDLHSTPMPLIKTSQEKQPEQDLTDSVNNRPQLSLKDGDSNMKYDNPKHHDVKGQAVAASGKNTSSNEEVPLQDYLETGFDEVQSKTSQNDSNPSEMPTANSSNTRFVESDIHPSTIKSTENHTSELVLPIRKSSLINKVAGNAVIHPFRRFYNKERLSILAKEMKDRNSEGVTQSGTSENGMTSRPKSTVVLAKKVVVAEEGNSSSHNVFLFQDTPIYRLADGKSHKTNSLFEVAEEGNSSSQNVFSFPVTPIYRSSNVNSNKTNVLFEVAEEGNSSSQNIFSFPGTPIYRSSDVKSHKTNSWPTIHRSAVKPLDWGNETKIDFSAVGVSQSLSPTSSVVVGQLVKMIGKASNRTSLSATTKTTLSNFQPVQFSDIAGSASFDKAETHSAYSKIEVVDVRSFSNRFNSTLKEEMTNSSSVTLNGDVQIPVSLSESEFIPTAATDTSMEFQLFHTEEYFQPQTPVYSTKLKPDHSDTDLFTEGTLIPHTTDLVTVTS